MQTANTWHLGWFSLLSCPHDDISANHQLFQLKAVHHILSHEGE